MSTLSAERTIRLAPASSTDALAATHVADASDDTAVVEAAPLGAATPSAAVSPPVEETTDVKATGTDAEPQDLPKVPALTDASPSIDISHDAAEPATPAKKPVDATPAKDTPKGVDEIVKKVPAKVDKDDDAKDGAGVKNDPGADAKPASGSDDK